MSLRWLWIPVALALVAAPAFLYPVFLMQAMCFAIFASAFNLLFGYTGLLSFGHAAYFGFAAYVCGWLLKAQGLSPELAILAGGATSALLGLVIGALAVRRQGIIFAMITMAFSEVVYFICLQAPFTGGEDGMQAIPRNKLLGFIDLDNPWTLYYFVLAVTVACIWGVYRIVHSSFGQVLKAIRENEDRTISLGYPVERFKLLAFVLSAAISGIAGSTKVVVFQFATLTDATWHKSGEVVLMTLLGGSGTLIGPTVGAFFVVTLNDVLSSLGEWVTFIIGAIFVACVLLFRKGLVGEVLVRWPRWTGRANPGTGDNAAAKSYAPPAGKAGTRPGNGD